MIRRRATALLAIALLAGCSPADADPPSSTPTPTAVVSSTPSPAPSPTQAPLPTPASSPVPDSELPRSYPIADSPLDGHTSDILAELHRVAGGLPVLKVDITASQITLTALLDDRGVVSYAWRGGQITKVDSDFQYLGQATFDPADYPVDSARRMFDVAGLNGVRGDELVLQIVQYRTEGIWMTVSSRPESTLVFFDNDGSAIPLLGTTSVDDIQAGITATVGEATAIYQFGFNLTQGYWVDLPDTEEGRVRTRSRRLNLPVFETLRTDSPGYDTFDPALLDAAGLARAVARAQVTPEQECAVTVDLQHRRSAPVARIVCDGVTHYADMVGRDMTALIG